jgi:hypothetical protein
MRAYVLVAGLTVWLSGFVLPSDVLAGGTITDPQDGNLEAGTQVQPSGTVDPIHQENGDTIKVKLYVKKAASGSPVENPFNWDTVQDNWSTSTGYALPGGDYVGGQWYVHLLINDNIVAITSGTITSVE